MNRPDDVTPEFRKYFVALWHNTQVGVWWIGSGVWGDGTSFDFSGEFNPLPFAYSAYFAVKNPPFLLKTPRFSFFQRLFRAFVFGHFLREGFPARRTFQDAAQPPEGGHPPPPPPLG